MRRVSGHCVDPQPCYGYIARRHIKVVTQAGIAYPTSEVWLTPDGMSFRSSRQTIRLPRKQVAQVEIGHARNWPWQEFPSMLAAPVLAGTLACDGASMWRRIPCTAAYTVVLIAPLLAYTAGAVSVWTVSDMATLPLPHTRYELVP